MSMDIQMTTEQVRGPAIHAQGLEKSYKELHVLRGVDFDVARGSICALLGSHGAGKTTVVRILSTLLKADAGTISVNGFDVATQAANVRESISLTGQFAAVDEILTGRENLVLIARLRHLEDPGVVGPHLVYRSPARLRSVCHATIPSRAMANVGNSNTGAVSEHDTTLPDTLWQIGGLVSSPL
jgi:ABC-2 type transport system ATP-binding protein